MEQIVFPDPAELTVKYLSEKLPEVLTKWGSTPDVWVATQVPNPRPARLVRVQDMGGQLRDRAHEKALLAVQCWDEAGEVEAGELSRLVTMLLRNWPADPSHGVQVTTTTCSRPYFFPDPDTRTPRYQTTFEMVYRPERNL